MNKYVIKQLRTSVQNKIKKKFDSFKFDEVDIGYVVSKQIFAIAKYLFYSLILLEQGKVERLLVIGLIFLITD